MSSTKTRVAALAAVSALVVGGLASALPASAADSKTGGTLTIQEVSTPDHWDPARVYTGEDLAMMGTFLFRSLTQYKSLPGSQGNDIQADLATNTGVPANLAKTWTFVLKSGATFQDGSAVTCGDVKYAASRVFAQSTITDGPQYPVTMLNVGFNSDGTPKYPGPYTATAAQKAIFDKAVVCGAPGARTQNPAGNIITFNLARSVADFNYSTTLLTYSPVQASKDSGEGYDTAPQATGPYIISNYPSDVTAPDSFVLTRNSKYNAASDGSRNAYPDKIVLKINGDNDVLDEAFITDAASASLYRGGLQIFNRTRAWNDDGTPKTGFGNREQNILDPYAYYLAVNVNKMNCLPLRKALLYAIDRKSIVALAGGLSFTGAYADSVVKPNLGQDYAPVSYDASFGDYSGAATGTATVTTDPKTKKTVTTITAGSGSFAAAYKWLTTAKADKTAACKAAVARATDPNQGLIMERGKRSSSSDTTFGPYKTPLNRLGIYITARYNSTGYYPRILSPSWDADFGTAGWGPDWSNASTVLPELFGSAGGFNASQTWKDAKYKSFDSLMKKALGTTDRATQANYWHQLAQYSMDQVWAIPRFFGKAQTMWGSNIGGNYNWAPYGSFAYNDVYLVDKSKDDSK